jgi:hypothetical protein
MNDVTKWESSQDMVDLFKYLSMKPKYLFAHEIGHTASTILGTVGAGGADVETLLILEAFATNEGYLVMEKNNSDKNNFLDAFVGGTDFSNVVGATPWRWKEPGRNVAADFYAALGRGGNNRIYFDKGWISWFPEGYSTMTLVEFYDEPKTKGEFKINGKVYHGEKAFARLQVLEVDNELGSPDSINRWEI